MGRIFPVPSEGVAPRKFALDANRVKTRKITLDAARDHVQINIAGTFLWAAEASSRSAKAYVSLSEESGDQGIPFKEGSSFRGVAFSSIWLTNTAQAGEWILLVYVVEEVGQISIDNPGAIYTSVSLVKSTTASDTADAVLASGATATIAADATRSALIIGSLSTNTENFRTGPGAAAGRGRELQPGVEHIWNTTAAIKIYNAGAGNLTYTLATEND